MSLVFKGLTKLIPSKPESEIKYTNLGAYEKGPVFPNIVKLRLPLSGRVKTQIGSKYLEPLQPVGKDVSYAVNLTENKSQKTIDVANIHDINRVLFTHLVHLHCLLLKDKTHYFHKLKVELTNNQIKHTQVFYCYCPMCFGMISLSGCPMSDSVRKLKRHVAMTHITLHLNMS